MALNPVEKELLAVVRYYNENKKQVAKLVTKLMKDFNLPDVKALTSLSGDEIMKLQDMTFRPRKLKHPEPSSFTEQDNAARLADLKPSKATKKVQASIREASTELDGEKGNEEIEIDGLAFIDEGVIKPKAKPSTSDAITLDADSPLHERIAYEMSMQIGAKFKQGDAFYTTKTAMTEFEVGQETVRGALKTLKEKGLIEYRDGNFRNGYVVV